MERKSFSDRRVLITGASSGIGLALARELARQGARLLLVARRQELLQSHVGELTALGAPSVMVLPTVIISLHGKVISLSPIILDSVGTSSRVEPKTSFMEKSRLESLLS